MAEEKPASTELVGWFWPPGEETEKLPGSLTIEPGGKMTLRVINQAQSLDGGTEIARRRPILFHGFPRNWYLGGDCGRLLGVVSGTTVSGRALQDEEITLDDCLPLTPAWLSEPSDIKFIVNRAYIGVALAPDEELQCERAHWVAEGIEEWLNPSGPSASELHYWERPATSVATNATIRGLGRARVTLGLLGGFSREKGNVYEIRESGSASVIVDQPTPWSKAAELVHHTHRFLRFALDRLCGVSQLMVQVNGRSVEIVEQTMRQGEARPYRPGQVRFDALFTADPKERGVVGDAESVLRTWLELPFAAQGTLLRLQGLMASSEFVDTQVVSACGARGENQGPREGLLAFQGGRARLGRWPFEVEPRIPGQVPEARPGDSPTSRPIEEHPHGECPPILDSGAPHTLDGHDCELHVRQSLGLEDLHVRIVVRQLALLLKRHELLGELEDRRGKAPRVALQLVAAIPDFAMFQPSVDMAPRSGAPRHLVGANQHVGTADREPVEQRVVTGTDGPAEVRLSATLYREICCCSQKLLRP